jgi:hypothetical protein
LRTPPKPKKTALRAAWPDVTDALELAEQTEI